MTRDKSCIEDFTLAQTVKLTLNALAKQTKSFDTMRQGSYGNLHHGGLLWRSVESHPMPRICM